jgi:hypothetical protein
MALSFGQGNTKSAKPTQKAQRRIIDIFALFVFLLLRFLCSPASSSSKLTPQAKAGYRYRTLTYAATMNT